MKDTQNILSGAAQAERAVSGANERRESVIRELDIDKLDRVSGAGNPFEDIPRPDPQPIENP